MSTVYLARARYSGGSTDIARMIGHAFVRGLARWEAYNVAGKLGVGAVGVVLLALVVGSLLRKAHR